MDPIVMLDAGPALLALLQAMALSAVGAIIGGKLWLLVRRA
jgi:hypothetical protein